MIQTPAKPPQETNTRLQTTPVAIIGMASILPRAKNLSEYWTNILRKIDCITEVPPSRWNVADYYDPDPTAADKTYCKRGGFIPDIDFDPAEFGLPPNILEVTDVSQLLALVVAKDALDDAGYGESREFNRELTGVVLGMVGMSSKLITPLMTRLQYPVWEKVLRNSGLSEADTHRVIAKIKLAYVGWEENAFPGLIGNVVAGRIANRFDLGGMNCVVDAACASSMAAVRMSVAELIEGRADMMITGGVDTDNSINTYMCFSKTPAFTKGTSVRTFDTASDGMMVGEGLGMIVLKRLADAERDHDRVYAVIKAIGTSSDGRFKSIYAPRPDGQSKALRRAYTEAGFTPQTVGLVEAHGTGTMAGDPAEFQGMKAVFGENNPNPQAIALGSVKSQIAHTKATAGVASLIKTSLALYHKVLPATINVSQPNPKFDIKNSPFYINTETRPWIKSNPDIPRRAGVSSFGFGGTNFHVVLEEYEPEHQSPYRLSAAPQMVLVSAANPEELITACRGLADRLQSEGGEGAYTELLKASREMVIPVEHARLGFLSDTAEEASHLLQTAQAIIQAKRGETSWEHPEGIFYREKGLVPQGKVVALFPGQGSQYVDMGRELAVNFPPVRQVFAQVDRLFLEDGLSPLSRHIYPPPAFEQAEKDAQNERLTRTENAQPAIGALSLGMFKLFKAAGFTPDFVAGHSFGELAALWAAGVLDDHDYLWLAKARGKAMAPPADPHFDAGAMLAVKGDAGQVAAEVKGFPRITLANWNSRHQVVLAGARPDIAIVLKALKEKGFSVTPLPVSAAFHTRLVGHAHKPFAAAIQSVKFTPPACRLYSNTTGKEYPSAPDAIRQVLTDHMLNPVLFKDEIEAIYTEGGRVFVEFGPKNVLTNLVDDILEGLPHLALSINPNARNDGDRQMREAALRLCVVGLGLGGIDPYPAVREERPPRKKSSVTVTLNGGLYVSEKTRKAFEDALQDGFKVTQTISPPASSPVTAVEEEHPQPPASLPQPASPLVEVLAGAVAQFQAQQSESLRLHEAFLKSESEYGKIFAELTQMEGSLVVNAANTPGQLSSLLPILENLERSMSRFHDHQGETLHIHGEYLKSQAETTQRYLELLQQMTGRGGIELNTAPLAAFDRPPALTPLPEARVLPRSAPEPSPAVLPTNGSARKLQETSQPAQAMQALPASPVPVPAPREKPVEAPPQPTPAVQQAKADTGVILTALLAVVSEKTGYPTEMLDKSMDMEADLGIDSIKRVEILGAMQTLFPELPKVEAEILAELCTLGQVSDYLSRSNSPAPAAMPATLAALSVEIAPEPGQNASAATSPAEIKLDTGVIASSLLEVVSEKTGYPVEMLDQSMDMEADLGIDSIKRVEILGAIQHRFPTLPKVEAEVLSELRTLGQVIGFLSGKKAAYNSGVPEPVLERETAYSSSVSMGRVNLKPLPMPDAIDFTLPAGSICLVTNDGSEAALTVTRSLSKQGMKVVVLSFPADIVPALSPLPAEIDQVQLESLAEVHIQQAIADIERRFGQPAVFVHLDPESVRTGDKGESINSQLDEKAVLKAVFLLAKHLKEPLSRSALAGRAVFMAAMHLDGEFGLGAHSDFEPLSGGLFGLVKTLNLEWRNVFCRALDFSPEIDPVKKAELILAEMHDPNRLVTEVGYSSQGRVTLVVEAINAGEVH